MVLALIVCGVVIAALLLRLVLVSEQRDRAEDELRLERRERRAAERDARHQRDLAGAANTAYVSERAYARSLGRTLGDANRRCLAAERSVEFLLVKVAEREQHIHRLDKQLRLRRLLGSTA